MGVIWTPGQRTTQPQAGVQPADRRDVLVVPGAAANIFSSTAVVSAAQFGRFGSAAVLSHDGSASVTELPESAGAFGAGAFSVTILFSTRPGFAGGTLIGNNHAGIAGGWLIYISGGLLTVNTNAAFSTTLSLTASCTDDKPHIVTLTRSSAGIYQWYVDGAIAETATTSAFDVSSGYRPAIGAQRNFGHFSGFAKIDVALVSLRPLASSAVEVLASHRNPWQLFEADNDPVFYSLGGGGGVSVDVPAGSVTLTGYAPTVTAGGTASTSVPAGAVTLTAYAPTVTAVGTASASVPLGTVAIAGYAPTVSVGGSASIDVPLGAVALTGYAPTVTTGGQAQIDVPLGTVALAGYAPTVTTTEHAYIAVPTAAMALAAYAPTVTASGAPDIWTPVSASTGTWTPQ